MRKIVIKIASISLIISFLLSSYTHSVFAESTYKTFTEDHQRKLVRTQDAYFPVKAIEGVGVVKFNAPSDIYIDSSDFIYVADTGNRRIVVIRPDESFYTFGEDLLSSPTGVFVANGKIYVADESARKVYQFTQEGKLVKEFVKPTSPLFGKGNTYKPTKIAVDKRGNLYIVSTGSVDGLVQLSPEGEFLGYFGSNNAPISLQNIFTKFFFSKKTQRNITKNFPPSPKNIAMDSAGLVYTVTPGAEGESVKRFNISGVNLLPNDMSFDNFYSDMFVGGNGNIYVAGQKGRIDEFDRDGNLLFTFGAPDDGLSRIGLFLNVSGIAVDSKGQIYILDKERKNIQIFGPSEFANEVHTSLALYYEGFYVKSEGPWRTVLQKNNLFDLAHKGLGDAFYKQQIYDRAMKEYVISNDKEGYSNAYWEVRNNWLQNNLAKVFVLLVILSIFWQLMKQLHRRKGIFDGVIKVKNSILSIKIVRELSFLFYFIKNPIDGFYGIKRENKASLLSATILAVIIFIEYITSLFYTGFIFSNIELSELHLYTELLNFFVPLVMWIIANYLISSITEGEGKFRDVYIATIYSLMPYIIVKPLLILFSNVLTLNEAFVYDFGSLIIMGWSGLLIFLMVKEIHYYTIRETIKNILLTIFGMIMLALVLFIVFVLLDQVYDFVNAVVEEVSDRVQS